MEDNKYQRNFSHKYPELYNFTEREQKAKK